MKRLIAAVAVAVLAAGAGTARAADKKRGTLQAQKAGWMMGMYVGEEKNNFYPFVIQVDKKSEAYEHGVREGDEIIRFDGEETNPVWRLFNKVNNVYPGHLVTMWVRRGVETYHFDLHMPRDPGLSPEERAAKEEEKAKKKAEKDAKSGKTAKADKKDGDGKTDGDDTGDGKDKKKDKKKGPVVIKPIPAPDGN